MTAIDLMKPEIGTKGQHGRRLLMHGLLYLTVVVGGVPAIGWAGSSNSVPSSKSAFIIKAKSPQAAAKKLEAYLAKRHLKIVSIKAEKPNNQRSDHRVQTGRGVPSASITSPNAFGGAGTSVFAGLAYENHWDGTSLSDGQGFVGAAFGNPYKYVGVNFSVLIDALGLRRDPFARNGAISLRLNRYLAKNTAVAAGMGNVVGWGVLHGTSKNFYLDVTQNIPLSFPVTLNFGAGTGNFYSVASGSAGRDDQIGVFGSVAVTVYKGLSLITDYTVHNLNVGATYGRSFKKLSFFITGAGINVAEYKGFKPHLQLIGGVSYALS